MLPRVDDDRANAGMFKYAVPSSKHEGGTRSHAHALDQNSLLPTTLEAATRITEAEESGLATSRPRDRRALRDAKKKGVCVCVQFTAQS